MFRSLLGGRIFRPSFYFVRCASCSEFRFERIDFLKTPWQSETSPRAIAAVTLEAGLTPKYARVCLEDTLPYARHLEDAALPNVGRIVGAVRGMI